MESHEDILMDLADTIIERPQGFNVGSRHFYLYPITLGKMYLLGKLMDLLEIDHAAMMADPFLEVIRIVKAHRDIVCRVLTYHTLRTKVKIFDNELVESRIKIFDKECDDKDLAQLLLIVLTSEKTEAYIKKLGIDEDQQKMQKVLKVKDNKNSLSFGQKSIYGLLIDKACERYGWTMDYVLWDISYTNLKLLLADSSKQIYLTEEEAKKLPSDISNKVNDVPLVDEDPQAGWDLVNSMKWD